MDSNRDQSARHRAPRQSLRVERASLLREDDLSDLWQDVDRAGRRAVAAENINAALSARLSPADPLWQFAAAAAASLEGPIVAPEQRERLLRAAQRMGVQRFDAGLVVALVQDRARRGATLDADDPALSLINLFQADRVRRNPAVVLWIAATLLAAGLAAAILALLTATA